MGGRSDVAGRGLSPDGWIFKAGTNEFSDTVPSLSPSSDGHRRRPAVRLRLQAKERRGRILSFILATDIRIFSISGFVNVNYEPFKFSEYFLMYFWKFVGLRQTSQALSEL